MRKYITITIVILVAPYVTSIFLASNPIGDGHEDRDHEFVLLYKGMPHSMNDGLTEHWLRDAIFDMIIAKRKIIQISLVFDDRVVEYNTCVYYHSQLSPIHVSSRATVDGESRLYDPECSVYILPNSFLTFSKQSRLGTLRKGDSFDESLPS